MLVDVFSFLTPGRSRISKVSNEFLLFRVHTQDRTTRIFKPLPEVRDQFELPVAIRMLCFGDALAVASKRILLLLEQLTHRIGTDAHSPDAHLPADRSRVFPAPLLTAHRVAGRGVFHQFIQKTDHVVFF